MANRAKKREMKVLISRLRNINKLFGAVGTWDWKIIGVCMFISSFIWVLNALNKNNYSTKIKFPIVINHSDSLVVEVKSPPKFITVFVTGSGWKLLEKSMGINLEPFELDLIKPTEHFFVTSNMLLPEITERLRDLKIVNILEDTIFFEYDSIKAKNVILAVSAKDINLAENCYLSSSIMTEPLTAKITGPSKQMKNLRDTFWIKIPDKNISQDYQQFVSLFPLPSDFMLIEPTTATVSFKVQEYERKFERVNLKLINFTADSLHYIRLAAPVYMEYKVPKNAKLQQSDTISAYLDLKKMNPKDSLITPVVFTTSVFKDVEIIPKAIKVSKKANVYEKNRDNRRNRQR